MKKIIALLLVCAMAASVTACGGKNTACTASGNGNTVSTSGTAPTASALSGEVSTSDLASKSKIAGTPDADMVTANMVQEPAELNPILTSDTASSETLRETTSGLTKLDKDDKPVLDLAESYTVSADKKTYTFKLRKDAKWSNGDPVTAKDYIFSWTTAMKKSTASVYSFIFTDNIEGGKDYFDGKIKEDGLGIKAPDDYTLVVTLTNPIPYALHLFSMASYMPVDQKFYESVGADKYGKEVNTVLSNGAYHYDTWIHNSSLTLKKNDNYWDKDKIGIPKIKFVMIKDANTVINAFKAGQLDYTTLGKVALAQMNAMGQPHASYVSGAVWYLQYNVTKKAFGNAKIRQAFGMAVNLDSYMKDVLKDGSVAATGLVPLTTAGANGSKYADARGDISQKFDPAKAKQLLDEGLKEVGMTKDQLKPSFITDDTTKAKTESTYLQEQWKKNLGVNVELKPMSFKARVAAMNNSDFDFVFAGWSPDFNDPMTFLGLFTTTNSNNNGKYSNKNYDALIAAAAKEADPLKRQNDFIQAEKLGIQQDAAVFPLYYDVIPYTISSKFTGVTCSPFQPWPGDYTDGAKLIKK